MVGSAVPELSRKEVRIVNDDRPLKIWGQPDPDQDGSDETAGKGAASRSGVSGADEVAGKGAASKQGASGSDETAGKVPGEGAASGQDAGIRVKTEREIVLTDLQPENTRGKMRRLKEKKDSLTKSTEAALRSGTGRKAMSQWEKLSRYLKTYRGRRVIYGIVLLVLAIVGVKIWLGGAELREGVKLCEEGRYVDAQVPLKNAVEKDNMNPKTYTMLGMAYLGSGEYEDALKQFTLALNLDPENQQALRGIGIVKYFTGEYKEAIDALNHALANCDINVNNTEYDIMWYRAAAETAIKDYEAAESTYNALMELEGETARLYYYRGSIYCKTNEKKKALADFDEAISKEGNSYDLYFDIYNSLMERGWSKEAEGYIAMCKQPGSVDSSKLTQREMSLYQGMLLYLEGSYKAAAKQLSAQELKEDFQALTYKALAYEGMNAPKKALSVYKQVLKLYPGAAKSYNAIALYYLRQGKEKKAISYLNKGVNSCPMAERRVLYYNMVTAYEQAADFKGAQEALRQFGVVYGQSKTRHEEFYVKERDRS